MSSSEATQEKSFDWTAIIALIIGGISIGFAPIGLRFAVDDGLGPQTTAFWRYLIAVPLLSLGFLIRGKGPSKPNLAVILAGTCFALDIGFWHLALTMTSVANATFIVNLGNIGVGFLAWIFLKDRPSAFWGVAIALAISGAFFLSIGGQSSEVTNLNGDLLAVLAACLVSFYMLFAAIARRDLSALDVIFWATVTETIIAALMAITFGETLMPASLSELRVPLFLAIMVQIIGQGLIVYGVGRAPASIAGVTILLQPVTASFISWTLFGETLSSLQLAGAGLILFAITFTQLGQSKRKA